MEKARNLVSTVRYPEWGIIDLHLHSDCSDGTESPSAMVESVAAAGAKTFALSDHDTTEGWADATAVAVASGMNFIPAMELSTSFESRSVHILAYLFDPEEPGLVNTTQKIRSARSDRIMQMAELISADYPITVEEVMAGAGPEGSIGRPHIADALIRANVVSDRNEAFETILHPRGPYYLSLYAPTPLEGVQQIVAAGGVAILAHPAARAGSLSEKGVRQLIAAGLSGFELDHRENEKEKLPLFKELAKEFDLIVTGSSDYHGTGKPNRIAENHTSPQMLERILALASGSAPVLQSS